VQDEPTPSGSTDRPETNSLKILCVKEGHNLYGDALQALYLCGLPSSARARWSKT